MVINYWCLVLLIEASLSESHIDELNVHNPYIIIPYPRERVPTTECPPTPLFWLNFLLRSQVYALYIVHNLLHYNNDAAAASYVVWNYVNMPVGCG